MGGGGGVSTLFLQHSTYEYLSSLSSLYPTLLAGQGPGVTTKREAVSAKTKFRLELYKGIHTSTKYVYIEYHSVCMSPRRNWDSPNPSLASKCAPGCGVGGVTIATTGEKA